MPGNAMLSGKDSFPGGSMNNRILAIVTFALLGSAGLARSAEPVGASAELKDKDGKTVGSAVLRDDPAGVVIEVQVKGLTPGLHAVHVHAVGRCEGPAFTTRSEE